MIGNYLHFDLNYELFYILIFSKNENKIASWALNCLFVCLNYHLFTVC